jgi:hypothetical protein
MYQPFGAKRLTFQSSPHPMHVSYLLPGILARLAACVLATPSAPPVVLRILGTLVPPGESSFALRQLGIVDSPAQLVHLTGVAALQLAVDRDVTHADLDGDLFCAVPCVVHLLDALALKQLQILRAAPDICLAFHALHLLSHISAHKKKNCKKGLKPFLAIHFTGHVRKLQELISKNPKNFSAQ